jgi:hypothetical protein
MRTTVAALPRALHWQAAFTTPYKAQISSLVVWQHVFVSDTPMTNWCGTSLFLSRIVKKAHLPQKFVSADMAAAESRQIAQNSKCARPQLRERPR